MTTPFPIDAVTMAKMMNVSMHEAQTLIEQTQDYMARTADEVLRQRPDLRAKFAADYERLRPIVEQGAVGPLDLESHIRQQALAYGLMEQASVPAGKIKASEVAEAFEGELPPGWDDLLPPEKIEQDVE